jgi:hypothetical protein
VSRCPPAQDRHRGSKAPLRVVFPFESYFALGFFTAVFFGFFLSFFTSLLPIINLLCMQVSRPRHYGQLKYIATIAFPILPPLPGIIRAIAWDLFHAENMLGGRPVTVLPPREMLPCSDGEVSAPVCRFDDNVDLLSRQRGNSLRGRTVVLLSDEQRCQPVGAIRSDYYAR